MVARPGPYSCGHDLRPWPLFLFGPLVAPLQPPTQVSNNAWDTNLVAGNGKYVSVNWQASGGGAFAIIPANRTGKLPDIYPLCRAHTAAVLDTAFSPFDDSFVASASDDGTVGLWKVDESVFEVLDLDEKQRAGRGIKDMEPVSRLQGGGR